MSATVKPNWTRFGIAMWLMIFLSPLLYTDTTDHNWRSYLRYLIVPSLMLSTYLFNYYVLIPKLYFHNRRVAFFAVNIVMVCALVYGIHLWNAAPGWDSAAAPLSGPDGRRRYNLPLLMMFKNAFMLFASWGAATAVRMTERWRTAEVQRRMAEKARIEAELKVLRAEIHPHFLLNTLNNIYALIAFDKDKAQSAVESLGNMLRHVLYDNQRPRVGIHSEIEFINDYINLMRLRLRSNVRVTTSYELPPDCKLTVAPNVGIALVENAFKHGVSTSEPSFVSIRIYMEGDDYVLCVANSNYPKPASNRSGHGVGLSYIRRRLDLEYGGGYRWTYGPVHDNKEYQSKITLYDIELYRHRR